MAIGRSLPAGQREIDARGKLVLPGGVDSHAHIEQLSAAGVVRISLGSAIAQAAYGLAARIATELLTTGTYESAASGVDYVTMNRAFTWTAGVRR